MIKIFSTYTKDEIYNQDNGLKITRNGGPAFFIENVFKKNKIKHKVISQKAVIEIRVKNGIESGMVRNELKEKNVKNVKGTDLVVISTVDGEWVLDQKVSGKAQVFLDVQGYVRGAIKNVEMYKSDFWNHIFCMKGNEREIKEIPNNIIKNQKNKCLIITKGSKGAVIYFKNKKYVFAAKKIKLNDSIGAGDTFFAGFIAGFVRNKGDVEKSGKFAIEKVGEFLLTKKS